MPARTIFAAVAVVALAAWCHAQTRVACLGDSITFGSRVVDREHNAYPALLGSLLGTTFEVRNFGVGGATLLRAADRPYIKTRRCAEAIAWGPDVAVIVLGTNDSCQNDRRQNWQHADDLEADARALISALRAARADMRVLLASPPAMFADKPGLAADRRDNLRTRSPRLARVAQAAQTVAAELDGVQYLELGHVLRTRDVVDGVHTTPFGAERLARRIAAAIANERTGPLAIEQQLAQRDIATVTEDFHGFACLRFELPSTGAGCRIVIPHGTARGAAWVLRARFFGHQPALDLALLERGFHVTFCDVAGLFGAPAAIGRWDDFYQLLQDLGFGKRALLEGMSRGGLPIINWAAAHPDRVAAIYGDNPVADFRSWPGGRSGKRSDNDWQRCLTAYGLSEEQAATYSQMPVDRLAPIAGARIPLLLVLGMADEVVPPAENGLLLAARYRELGGPVQLWCKPGQHHHPHGLQPIDPLMRAMLRAVGIAAMPTTTAAPSVEYRRGAGWGEGTWRSQLALMRSLVAERSDIRVAFLGDSITQGLTGANNRIAQAGGSRAVDKSFGELGAISLGLSGDRTEHLLYRIEHGALAAFDPAVIVLQIGVNNVNAAGHTADEVAAGIAAVLRSLAAHEPQARVVLCGPFPCDTPDAPRRRAIDRVHELVQPLGDERVVFYRDLRGLFVDAEGNANDRMRKDLIHITGAGQQAWLQAIRPMILDLLE